MSKQTRHASQSLNPGDEDSSCNIVKRTVASEFLLFFVAVWDRKEIGSVMISSYPSIPASAHCTGPHLWHAVHAPLQATARQFEHAYTADVLSSKIAAQKSGHTRTQSTERTN